MYLDLKFESRCGDGDLEARIFAGTNTARNIPVAEFRLSNCWARENRKRGLQAAL